MVQPSHAGTDADTKPCPMCAETIKAAAIRCRFCNADLSAMAIVGETGIEKVLFKGHPSTITHFGQWPLIVLTVGIGFLVYWFKRRAITYELTTQRVRISRGLLSIDQDTVELFRIDHFDVHKPFGMRLVGHCMLHLRSSDPSFTTIILFGIPHLEALADQLRECSLHERTRRGITTFVKG